MSTPTRTGPSSVSVEYRPPDASPVRRSWLRPLSLVVGRTLFLLLAQAIFAALFALRGSQSPWQSAAAWWTVWGTLADVACVMLLVRYTRREGIRLRDLAGFSRERWPRDVLLGLGYFALIFPVFMLSSVGGSALLWGSMNPAIPAGQLHLRALPLWAMAYSLFPWWVLWSATEELTYQGYGWPRLGALTSRQWMASAIVLFWWTAQHAALPLILDWRYVAWRFIAFVPGLVLMMYLYRRGRRLPALIVAHWLIDLFAAATTLKY